MTFLQLFWFGIIGLLFALFLFLDGFDFGVGMATKFLANDEDERALLIRTIGPHWDGNEVWLITAGGAMFASFPLWYASLFSGFYLLFFCILIALIFRGVSFEFAAQAVTKKGRNGWQTVNFWSSLAAAFLLGMLFTAMIQPLPIDAKGDIYAHFTNVVNWLSVVGGVAVVVLCFLHGLHYISLKTDGDMRVRSRNLAGSVYWIVYPAAIVLVILLYLQTNFFTRHPLNTWIILIIIVLLTVFAQWATYKKHEVLAFLGSGLTLMMLVVLVFSGLFPDVIIGTNPKHSLLIETASSSPYTLKVMTIVLVILLPILAVYYVWSYLNQWGRIKLSDNNEY